MFIRHLAFILSEAVILLYSYSILTHPLFTVCIMRTERDYRLRFGFFSTSVPGYGM